MATINTSILVERHGRRFDYLDRRLNRATGNQEKDKRVLMRELVRFDLRYATENGYNTEQKTDYRDEGISSSVHSKQLELAALAQEIGVFNAWSFAKRFFSVGLIATLGCGVYFDSRLYGLLTEVQNQLPETDKMAHDIGMYKLYLGLIGVVAVGVTINRVIDMVKTKRIRKATRLAEQEVLNSIDFSKIDGDKLGGIVEQIREERQHLYRKIDEEASFVGEYISLLDEIRDKDHELRLTMRILALRQDGNLGIVLDNLTIDQIQQFRSDVREATTSGELAAIVRRIENIEGIERHHSEPTF